jgi:hypothetical protein
MFKREAQDSIALFELACKSSARAMTESAVEKAVEADALLASVTGRREVTGGMMECGEVMCSA